MKADHDRPSQKLFAQLSFLIFTDGLSPGEIQSTRQTIEEHGGKVQLTQSYPTTNLKANCDYLLCESNLDPDEVRQSLPKTIKYKQALEYTYISNCLVEQKLLKPANSRLRVPFKEEQVEKSKTRKQVNMGEGKQQAKPQAKKDITRPNFSINKFIIDELNKLYKVYANEGDKGRKIAYSRAIAAIKSLDKELTTEEEIEDLKTNQRHIGPKIVDKIKELLRTGSIRKLQQLKGTDENLAAEELTRVWGIGSAKAKELYQRGIKSIPELRQQVEKHPQILTKNQLIGLKYLQDFEIRIPRKKVTLMFEYVRQTLFELVGSRDLHEIEACGSYRRGKPTCGDMDIFITTKSGQFEKTLLYDLVKSLTEKQFLTDHLTMPRNQEDKNSQSYMGVCKFKDELHHRIDIKYYRSNQFPFAILYFTGSDTFNRKMRLQAMEQGFHLSDHGMYRTDKNEEKAGSVGKPIICKTQREIFEVLNLEYKKPQDRDI